MSSVYTKLFLKKRKEDSFFLIIVFFVMLIFSGFFVFFPTNRLKIKSKSSEIEFITLTNLMPSQVSVIWKTSEPQNSFLLFGDSPDKLVFKAEDELYEKGKDNVYHYATLKGLKPDTEYFFAIKVKNKLIGKGNMPIRVKTPSLFIPSNFKPLIGVLQNEKRKPLVRKIVILQIENAFPLSSITGEKGEFVIPLSLIFDKEGKKKLEISGKENFELKTLGSDLVAKGVLKEFLNYSFPLFAGREYFFKESTEDLSSVDKSKIKRGNYQVILIYPKESAVISNLRPLIKGKGVPLEEVLVQIIGKKSIVLRTRVDTDGYWQADLPVSLAPDKYIIKVQTVDNKGEKVEIVRDFRITKGGESVLAEATPSGNLKPTPTVEPSPTPTPTLTPTSTPAIEKNLSPSPPAPGFNINMLLWISIVFLLPGIVLLLK